MDANPYAVPPTAPILERDNSRWLADALYSAFASFGTSQFSLLVAISFVWHGRFVAIPIHDSLQVTIAIVSAISAVTVFAAVSARRLVRTQWIAPITFASLTLIEACGLYVVGFPGTGRGAIDLSPFFCGCLIASAPLVVAFTIVRFSVRRLIGATIPYMLWLFTLLSAFLRG